jgi:adenylate cyclase
VISSAPTSVDDAETLGMLARTHKDLGLQAQDRSSREAHLEAAYRLYERAYSKSLQQRSREDALYTGINAATVAVLRGQLDEARWLAAEVHRLCTEAPGAADPR